MGKTGVTLNGGGSKGIVQWGMWKAFRELGFDYDIMFSVSVGALNGSIIHQGDENILEELWMTVKDKDVYRWRPTDLFRPLGDKASLYDSTPLFNMLNRLVDFEKARANPRNFRINVTDLKNKDEADYSLDVKDFDNKEDYVTFLRASAAPPVFFEPVYFKGRVLGDGGLVSNFNQQAARLHGCDRIIMLYPNNDPEDPKIDNILEALGIVTSLPSYSFLDREKHATEEMNKLRAQLGLPEIEVIFIKPKQVLNVKLLDFQYKDTKYSRKDLIEIGYESALERLQDVRPYTN